MSEVLHANIFFVIASIGVVLFTLLVCVILYHLLKIVKSVRRIVERVEEGTEVIADDIEQLRNSFNPARLIQFVMSMMPGVMPSKRRTRKSKKEE